MLEQIKYIVFERISIIGHKMQERPPEEGRIFFCLLYSSCLGESFACAELPQVERGRHGRVAPVVDYLREAIEVVLDVLDGELKAIGVAPVDRGVVDDDLEIEGLPPPKRLDTSETRDIEGELPSACPDDLRPGGVRGTTGTR